MGPGPVLAANATIIAMLAADLCAATAVIGLDLKLL